MSFRDDRERIIDILTAIDKALKYTKQTHTPFLEDELVQVWVIHHIQIIGEAAAKISDSFQENHPEIPWRAIIAMRNILVHQYFRINHQEIIHTLVNDLPKLSQQLSAIVSEMDRQ